MVAPAPPPPVVIIHPPSHYGEMRDNWSAEELRFLEKVGTLANLMAQPRRLQRLLTEAKEREDAVLPPPTAGQEPAV